MREILTFYLKTKRASLDFTLLKRIDIYLIRKLIHIRQKYIKIGYR